MAQNKKETKHFLATDWQRNPHFLAFTCVHSGWLSVSLHYIAVVLSRCSHVSRVHYQLSLSRRRMPDAPSLCNNG